MKEGRVYPTRRRPEAENVELVEVQPVTGVGTPLVNAWQVLHRQADTLSKWKHYACRKRDSKKSSRRLWPDTSKGINNDVRETKGFLDSDVEEASLEQGGIEVNNVNESDRDKPAVELKTQTSHSASNRALLIYFAKLARADSDSTTTIVDFDFVDSLLQSGADVNVCDRYGQTIFHEAARAWHCDVALYLMQNGGDLNGADKFGRTPLHVAAAVDYPEMITFLFEHGADLKACTKGENQTPVHYAAKNDADNALKMLIKLGADVNCRDYKQRTPLQVAAELDRSETAKLLVRLGVHAGVCDENGLPALSLMIAKMPPVAKEALEQFRSLDRANRKQYYYLNHLVPSESGHIKDHILAKTPLEQVVRFKQMDLIMHPVFQRLIQVKWRYFGKTGSIIHLSLHLLFCLLWTIIGITLPRTAATSWSYYNPPSKFWWRIVLESLAVSITALFIWQEIAEVRQSQRQHKQWQKWRIGELNRDLKYCHPRWPEEGKYIKMEMDEISKLGLSYFESYWNFFDWITYFAISIVIITRVISVAIDNALANDLHPKVMAISLIVIWLRLMKVFRAFKAVGPFIVMIGHIMKDTLIFGFLYIEFFIPYVCAFWIIFGGDENAAKMKAAGVNAEDWRTFNNLMYSVWEITVVGNYSWESLLVVDRLMAQILCGTYLAVSSIVCLNLFIALMSDTFQRVYDNANANAVMQKASAIISLETDMSPRKKDQFLKYIHTCCAPEELYYDDDSNGPDSGELERLTHQIKEKVDEVEEMVKKSLDERTNVAQWKHHVDRLREDLLQVVDSQSREMKEMRQDIADIKQILTQTSRSHPQGFVPLTKPPPGEAPSKTHSGGPQHRKHRDKTSSKHEPELNDSGGTVSIPTTLPGVDIRREQPRKDNVLVTPGQKSTSEEKSTC